jgi:hypothetical protein
MSEHESLFKTSDMAGDLSNMAVQPLSIEAFDAALERLKHLKIDDFKPRQIQSVLPPPKYEGEMIVSGSQVEYRAVLSDGGFLVWESIGLTEVGKEVWRLIFGMPTDE